MENKSWFETLAAQLIQLTDKKLRHSSSSEYRYLHTGIWNQGEFLGLITKVAWKMVPGRFRWRTGHNFLTGWEAGNYTMDNLLRKKKLWTTVTRKIMIIWNLFFVTYLTVAAVCRAGAGPGFGSWGSTNSSSFVSHAGLPTCLSYAPICSSAVKLL